ncbi:MAG: putative signal-transduction protein with CBS domain [Candidatus Rokubacteria bacterium]|nr:putative signal-transduction protein with CBS domain [Candidatus Rokubacteria bacterium]
MRTKNVGAVVVVRDGRPAGILTDRDVAIGVVGRARNPALVKVGEVMRKNPTVIQEDAGILDAARLLGKKGVRRLPVVNTRGELVGIISLDDILVLLTSEMGHIGSALSQEMRRPKP